MRVLHLIRAILAVDMHLSYYHGSRHLRLITYTDEPQLGRQDFSGGGAKMNFTSDGGKLCYSWVYIIQ